ncbi:aKG-HExxH-type peptide beta-hydroxylase [Pseudoroseicyclus sp. CXY001]|uniref:aKG-HExxH-type peptide beta-hydroxylase n=1 Tax=Pseudoroseicyclus sp. CXY001 TaxID=3242492 RepID=UPI0035711873
MDTALSADDELLGAFAPSGARGHRLDRIVHDDLAASLDHVSAAIDAGPPGWEAVAEALSPARARLTEGARLAPVAFGLYYQLVSAIYGGRPEEALEAAEALSAAPGAPLGYTIDRRGADPLFDRVLDARMGEEAETFAPIDPAAEAPFAALLSEGMDLMARTVPDLHDELGGILSQIVLAQSPPDSKIEFDGASHFQFWGMVLLNPKHHPTPLAVVEVLAHETGHALLFGLTRDEPLVLNPDDELFSSPLRRDPRPMDGIYHATFVSARMAWTMERLAESDLISADERDRVRKAAAQDRENFVKGLGTVREHGRLTATGQRILAGAEAAMNG